MTTQTIVQAPAQPIVENHQGFNGDNHWFLCRFATRWAYREKTPFGLIEAGTDAHGRYWAACKDTRNDNRPLIPVADDHVFLSSAFEELAKDLARLEGHQWQAPIDALAELIGDD